MVNVDFDSNVHTTTPSYVPNKEYAMISNDSGSTSKNNYSDDDFAIEQPSEYGNITAYNLIRNYSFINVEHENQMISSNDYVYI